MPDYQELYLKLFRASEQAIHLLIAAQQECEELYLHQPEPEIALTFSKEEDSTDGVL